MAALAPPASGLRRASHGSWPSAPNLVSARASVKRRRELSGLQGPPTCLPPLLTGAPGRNLASPRILLFPDRIPLQPWPGHPAQEGRRPVVTPPPWPVSSASCLGHSKAPYKAFPSPPRPASSKPLSTRLPERQQIPLTPTKPGSGLTLPCPFPPGVLVHAVPPPTPSPPPAASAQLLPHPGDAASPGRPPGAPDQTRLSLISAPTCPMLFLLGTVMIVGTRGQGHFTQSTGRKYGAEGTLSLFSIPGPRLSSQMTGGRANVAGTRERPLPGKT